MKKLSVDSRNWAMMAHLSAAGFAFFLPSMGFIGPALVWLTHKSEPEVVYHARQSMFFQLAIMLTCWTLATMGALTACFGVGWLFWLIALPPAASAVLVPLYGAVRVSNGEQWRYPIIGAMVHRDPQIGP